MVRILLTTLLFTLCINGQKNQIDKNAFGQVKQIYVEDETSPLPITKGFTPHLRTELAKYGFNISDTKENVQAIMSCEISVQVTLDGDGNNPPDKAIYHCKITSSANSILYWKETIKVVLKSDWTENNKYGAQKIAEKIYKDRQKSVKKQTNK